MLTIIPHTNQNQDWDCGLACVSMVLQGIGCLNCSSAQLAQTYPTDSLWTIDLAYLLRHYGVNDFTMYTSHIGVNWKHKHGTFYKDSIQNDLKRIHSLFANAKEHQIRVVPSPLTLDDMRRFILSDRYAIILLVNLNLLSCHLCAEKHRKFLRKPCCAGTSPEAERTSSVSTLVEASEISEPSIMGEQESDTLLSTYSSSTRIRINNKSQSILKKKESKSLKFESSFFSTSKDKSIYVSKPTMKISENDSSSNENGDLSSSPISAKPSASVAQKLNWTTRLSLSPTSSTSSFGTQIASPSLPRAGPAPIPFVKTGYVSQLPNPNPVEIPTTISPLIPKSKKSRSCLRACSSYGKKGYELISSTEFVGHFIVIIGYDVDTDMFFYRDPGTDSELCAVSGDTLEKAFSCDETDRDSIVIRIM
ncbi:Guanylylate cyclase-domain-containing protein [Globomyces pollinis-pini]|nr:Guanylylate cyclase-domain-containing protein [Globomyces pollinis-pini]